MSSELLLKVKYYRRLIGLLLLSTLGPTQGENEEIIIQLNNCLNMYKIIKNAYNIIKNINKESTHKRLGLKLCMHRDMYYCCCRIFFYHSHSVEWLLQLSRLRDLLQVSSDILHPVSSFGASYLGRT